MVKPSIRRIERNPLKIALSALLCFAVMPAVAQAQEAGFEFALRSALSMHPTISSKRALVEAKGFNIDAAKSQRLPSLTAQAQQQDSAPRTAAGTETGNAAPVSLRARQPIWAFGRIDGQIAFADADARVELADLQRVQRQLMESTALAYANVLGSRKRVLLANAHSQALRSLYEQILRREQGQLASRADVNLAATRLAQARVREQRYTGELEVAMSELLALTQQPIDADQPVPERFTELPALETLQEIALSRSTELAYKEQLVQRARLAIDQVKSMAMPTVFLQAEQLPNPSGYRNDRRISIVLEGALEGMGQAALGQTRAAQAQLTSVQQDLLAARNETTRSVRRLGSNRLMLDNLIKTQAVSLIDQATLLESYKRQYEAGTKSWLELLNTQREVNDQQLQQVQAESEWLTLSLQLSALTGGFDSLTAAERDKNHE